MGKTRGVHETTPEIRNRMVGMYEAGLGLRDIAAAVNCSQRTVKRWLNRFDKEGTVETRDRCGRKRATTQEQDEAIIRLATQTPITAAKAVLPALGLHCSVDTVRERLHKAGIHNWSPSKKHIQKIAVADGAGIHQAVWRPTGTQLGKKKSSKGIVKIKNSCSQPKKKIDSQKSKSKQIFESNGVSNDNCEQGQLQPNFSFSQPLEDNQTQLQINNMQSLVIPPPPSLSEPVIMSTNQSQYNPLNQIPQSQPIYHHHSGLNTSQNWPLDLVQGTHDYAQNQHTAIHEQHPLTHIPSLSQLHNQHDSHLSQPIQNTIQPSIHQHCSIPHQKIDQSQIEHHQERSELSQENSNKPQVITVNVCSDVCSNSKSHSNESSQNSVNDDEISTDNNFCKSKQRRIGKIKKKKGGKVKGILETSLEIRNRMIGMSEAGLSTLSIALSLNRSERTVKRWLDRWYKEGNVQTKERKGRRRITTKEQDDAIIAMATQNPLTAAKFVAPALGLKCSVDTIRERLHEAGIHSWKLGRKQGEGNTVHTVHLWQPSGNRSNKVKATADKNKKFKSMKRIQNSKAQLKQINKKQKVQSTVKPAIEHTNIIAEGTNSIQYQNTSESPVIMTTMHELSSTSTALAQPLPIIQHAPILSLCSQESTESQVLQPIGPIMPPRPDCRLALSAVVPAIVSQSSANIAYPSCMMGSTSHTGQMDQSDPMNYEPYIWSF